MACHNGQNVAVCSTMNNNDAGALTSVHFFFFRQPHLSEEGSFAEDEIVYQLNERKRGKQQSDTPAKGSPEEVNSKSSKAKLKLPNQTLSLESTAEQLLESTDIYDEAAERAEWVQNEQNGVANEQDQNGAKVEQPDQSEGSSDKPYTVQMPDSPDSSISCPDGPGRADYQIRTEMIFRKKGVPTDALVESALPEPTKKFNKDEEEEGDVYEEFQRQDPQRSDSQRQRQEAQGTDSQRQRQEAQRTDSQRQRQEAQRTDSQRQRQEAQRTDSQRQRQESQTEEAYRNGSGKVVMANSWSAGSEQLLEEFEVPTSAAHLPMGRKKASKPSLTAAGKSSKT